MLQAENRTLAAQPTLQRLSRVEGPIATKNDEIDHLLTRHHAEYTRIGHPPARLKRAVEVTR